MKKNKPVKIFLFLLSIFAVVLFFYIESFKDIEQVCRDRKDTEVYLLNYVTKQHLKDIVEKHNKKFKLKGNEFTRIYLLNSILTIPDPVFDDSKINYKKEGCEQIDIMDIYCEIRYRRLSNGKIDIWYNFME